MCQEALQTIFRSVTIAKLLDASSAWSGFTKATDRQQVKGFLRRSIRCGYCSPDFPTFAEQCATVEKYFDKICLDNNHILHCLLPPPTTASQSYNLRPRMHSLELSQHSGHLTDSNFITRMLFTDIYKIIIIIIFLSLSICSCVLSTCLINEYE